MATITSSGIGSGLDVNSLVTQLIALEKKPLVALDLKEAVYQAQLSAFGSLKGALSAFQTSVRALNSPSRFQALKTSVGDATLLGAAATFIAAPGTHTIEVGQLAASHKLASAAFNAVSDPVGTGTISFQFGTWDGATFEANAAKPTRTVSIESAQNSLGGVRDAINAAGIGVNAAILNDGSGYKLVLTSSDTGAANSLRVTVADTSDASDTDAAGLSRLAYDPAGTAGNGRNLAQTVAAQNALLTVDGIEGISKASNTITDVLQGVTLNLLKAAPGAPTTLKIARDGEAVRAAVGDFVKAYNDLAATARELTGYDAAAGKGGLLQGDAAARSLLERVRQTLNTPVAGLSGGLQSLSDIGVSFQRDGTLSLDAARLQAAIDNSFDDIAGLLAARGRASDSLINYTAATAATRPGAFAVQVSQLATQSSLAGVTTAGLAHTAGTFAAPLVIDASNDTLSLKIDGIASGTITLAHGSYATAAALSAELQSKINGDSALAAARVTAAVDFDTAGSRLTIASARYGTGSSIEISAVDAATAATLGLSVAAGTAGVDVAGTINGAAATGAGRFLTAAAGNDAEGLRIEIVGGATGGRGTISFSRGYADRLDTLIGQMLASAGSIAARTSGIGTLIKDLNTQRERINQHLADTETRLRAQFSALDSLVAQLRSTSDFLTQQFSALQGLSSSSKGNR